MTLEAQGPVSLTVWLNASTLKDLRWIQSITGDETPSEAIGSLIANECYALNGQYAEELRRRRKDRRTEMRASRRIHKAITATQ